MFEKPKVKLTERERQYQIALRENAAVLGKRFMVMFIISVVSVGLSVITILNAYVFSNPQIVFSFGAIDLALSIAYVVMLFLIGKYNENFTHAGVAYILAQIASVVKSLILTQVGTLFSLMASALSIAYIVKLCTGMEDCFNQVDAYLAETWVSFKKAFLIITIASIACVLLVFVPILSFLAVIGALFCSIAAIVISVWQFVLLYRSSKTMTDFSKTTVE